MRNQLQLNCDMGESLDRQMDEQIMPYIEMANLACAFHAGNPVTMHKSIKSAKENGVKIGAHPSYPDIEGFGRRDMKCSPEEIISFMLYQCGALDALCRSYGVKIEYIKPHGALYNTMMTDEKVFRAVAKAVSKYDKTIQLMVLSKDSAGGWNIVGHTDFDDFDRFEIGDSVRFISV